MKPINFSRAWEFLSYLVVFGSFLIVGVVMGAEGVSPSVITTSDKNTPVLCQPEFRSSTVQFFGNTDLRFNYKPATSTITFCGRDFETWLIIGPLDKPDKEPYGVDGAYYPETTKITITHQPLIKKVKQGWEITFYK